MTGTTLIEAGIALLVAGGGLFGLIGSWGLLRLPDAMQRLHAPTKATTIGVGTALIASSLDLLLTKGHIAWEEVLVAVFLFVTAPLSALMLAKVHLAKAAGPPKGAPPPGNPPSE